SVYIEHSSQVSIFGRHANDHVSVINQHIDRPDTMNTSNHSGDTDRIDAQPLHEVATQAPTDGFI
ncbi:TPA: hypothetical protein ACJYBQ_006132, partial [Pseudomonas aeruginosa]